MAAGDESISQEVESAAISLENDLNSITEVDAIQNVSTAEQASTSTADSKNDIPNAKRYINEECQTFLANSPLETISIKEQDLKKTNLDEYLHLKPGISSREECNENPLGTYKKVDLVEQHSHEIKSVENEIAKEMLGNEIHPECLQENKFLISHNISSNEHNVCVPGIRAANDTTISLGVWKPIIRKSSVGRTNKIVRTDLNVQSPGSQCIGLRIAKAPYRKKSPLNWFPRKKTESFLERKIRMLQEAEGMKTSLDETLFGSNIILPRVEREKRAVQAAAKEAMETRKAALVEASWCRILEAARISCTLAAEELEKAEKKASEALAKAGALGVILKSNPSSSKHSCEDGSPRTEEGLNYTITASFETAFDVDKEVAAAVKVAFRRLSQHPDPTPLDTLGADGCKSRIRTEDALGISCNDELEFPEGLDGETCLHEWCFEADAQPDSEVNGEKDTSDSMKLEAAKLPLESKILKKLPSNHEVSVDLVKLMLERMKFLSTEELTALEQIVSSRGLGALLQEQNAEVNARNSGCGLADMLVKHVSRLEAEKAAASKSTVLSRASKKKTCHEDISDLGSILVKHTSKLEKEIEEAKRSSKGEERRYRQELGQKVESLDQVLVKRISKLEKEKKEAAATAKTFEVQKATKSIRSCTNEQNTLGLGDILKKRVPAMKDNFFKGYANKKENDANMIGDIPSSDIKQTNTGKRESKEQVESLDKILIKRMSRLEKEKAAAAAFAKAHGAQRTLASTNSEINDRNSPDLVHNHRMNAQDNTNDYANKYSEDDATSVFEKPGFIHSGNNPNAENVSRHDLSSVAVPGLENVLIKRVSKFEKEIEAAKRASTIIQNVQIKEPLHDEKVEKSLDKVLVKHVSRLAREKLAASKKETSGNSSTTSTASSGVFEGQHPNQTGENQIQSINVFIPENIRTSTKPDVEILRSSNEISHSSCTKSSQVKQGDGTITETSETDPFPVAIRKMSRLEIEKQQAAALAATGSDPWQRRRITRDQELESVWGGLGLGNALRPYVSKLELEQAAWREEEMRHRPSH